MKKAIVFAATLGVSITAHAAGMNVLNSPPFPPGCVKLESEIKFSAKNIYFEDGHLTAGNLSIDELKKIDPKMPDVIRDDQITGLKSDDRSLIVGDVALSTLDLGQATITTFENDSNPRAKIRLSIRPISENSADISGSLTLDGAQSAMIVNQKNLEKMRRMAVNANPNLPRVDQPISVCGLGLQLYVSPNRKVIKRGAIILHLNVNGKIEPFAIEAKSERSEPIGEAIQMADAPQASDGSASAL